MLPGCLQRLVLTEDERAEIFRAALPAIIEYRDAGCEPKTLAPEILQEMMSFLATEISAVTIIAVPATAYSENWQYGQFFVGSSLAKLAAFVSRSISAQSQALGSGSASLSLSF